MADLGRWERTIVDGEGNFLAGATVTVLQDIVGQPAAALYSDRGGTTPLPSNVLTADSNGKVAFYAAGGFYQITAALGGFSEVLRYVPIGTAQGLDAQQIPLIDANLDLVSIVRNWKIGGDLEFGGHLFGKRGSANFFEVDTYDSGGGGDNIASYMALISANDDGWSDGIGVAYARGTLAAPELVQNGDEASALFGGFHDGDAFRYTGVIKFLVDGAPAAGDMPTRMSVWLAADGSVTPTEALRLTNAGNLALGTAISSPGAKLDVGGSFRTLNTTTPIDTDHSFYFGTYECLSANFMRLEQSENQGDFDGGGFRDVLTVFHYDDDTTDYEALSDQKVSYGIRSYVTPSSAARLLTHAQYKDYTAGTFEAIGYIMWPDRGVSGITASAIQYGEGIASNEFAASNPASSSSQSLSMAALQAILSSKKGAADGSHAVRGVLVSNLGKLASAAFDAISAGSDGDNGQYDYLLRGSLATVATAAILMPASASGNVGTRIIYDTGDFTEFDRSLNTFVWAVGGSGELGLNASALYPITDAGLTFGASTNRFSTGHFNNIVAYDGIRVGFSGTPTADAVMVGDSNFGLDWTAGATPLLVFDANDYFVFNRASNFYDHVIGGNVSMRNDMGAGATTTGLMIYDVDNNALERVTVGAAGSGGTGKKVLCINN